MSRIAQSPEHRAREARQRRLVRDRDVPRGEGPVCLLERRIYSGRWIPCGRAGANQTVHIVRRNECGDFWDAPEVAILGCLQCHRYLDLNYLAKPSYDVRVPFQRAADAWIFLLEKYDAGELKFKPIARFNPFANDVYADVRGAA